MSATIGVTAPRQVNEVLSGCIMANGGVSPANGVWHVGFYVTDTGGATLTVVAAGATGTVVATLQIPYTGVKATVASTTYFFSIPVTYGATYTLAGTGITFVSGGGGVILPA